MKRHLLRVCKWFEQGYLVTYPVGFSNPRADHGDNEEVEAEEDAELGEDDREREIAEEESDDEKYKDYDDYDHEYEDEE